MNPLSQRDPRWGKIKLGFSETLIHNYGCTITSLSYILQTTPDIVNEKLKEVKGFKNNLVIWSAISQAFPKVEQASRVTTWNEKEVKNNLPCMVEVDGSPIGASRHWVVYLGDNKLMDPWFGDIRATSFYKPTGYTIIKLKKQNNTMPDSNTKSLEEKLAYYEKNFPEEQQRVIDARKERDEIQSTFDLAKNNWKQIETDFKNKISGLEEENTQQKNRYKELIAYLASTLGTTQDEAKLKGEVTRLVGVEDTLTKERTKNGELAQDLQNKQNIVSSLEVEVEKLKNELKNAKGLGTATEGELLIALYEKVISRLKTILQNK